MLRPVAQKAPWCALPAVDDAAPSRSFQFDALGFCRVFFMVWLINFVPSTHASHAKDSAGHPVKKKRAKLVQAGVLIFDSEWLRAMNDETTRPPLYE